ncbi:PQQ-dependent sugar dehydrogenase [Candidatus Nitrospira bockiana]
MVTTPACSQGRRTSGIALLLLIGALAMWPAATCAVTASGLRLQPVVPQRFDRPLYVAEPPGSSGRLFVVEQPGRIRVIHNGVLVGRPFLDITGRVLSTGWEQGLLGLAFHPAYPQNGRYIVNYTRRPDGATVIAEYRATSDRTVSTGEERVLLVIPQPYTNHNGGMVEFGPDGFLYIGMGDGGSRGDPENRGQDTHELLGKMLRIDVDGGKPYAIPPDNPFAAGGGRPEIFALGLRNPWRFAFDRKTGALWVADVGQNDWEEIDLVQRGGNYGWRIMEGRHCFAPRVGCSADGLIPPVAEYPTREPRCSIIGGYVYRGRELAGLDGTYVYADYCSGEVLGLQGGREVLLLATGFRISSLGQDQAGELYVIDHGGTVYRLMKGK